ncbi:centaurin-gamma-1A isoform X15 [Patella vulgata]|uniref:centaurin-gamma-1A isoform X15 n=1 Tax=Patella vulgata TaxID=6465 RepID=UPI00217FFA67|nr:centaurin-gamma-1A isoform X15 [Patella vulgata]
MNSRSPMQQYWSNSLAIRQEIQRFESVHPSIYAIYDLIEAIPDPLIQQQIREHVVCIEDSFVNSQEWTISRSVPDIKLGILGSVNSGKSALVHRYLTGSYMQEESPEGGRFKKEVTYDGGSYLLLIRDEGGSPEMQFVHWVDAVVFVFSLENEMSFQAVYSYYAKMAHYRNAAEIPLILVGTQDAISESNPRVIDDTRARKLANDLKRCSYYETCATYGLNVERVFQDACQRIVQTKFPHIPPMLSTVVPSTPNHSQRFGTSKPYDSHSTSSQSTSSSGTLTTNNPALRDQQQQEQPRISREKESRESKTEKSERKKKEQPPSPPSFPPPQQPEPPEPQDDRVNFRDPAVTTPVTPRKNKKTSVIQKSNSFSPKKDDEKDKTGEGEKFGSGRCIPLKQGYLYKKSHGLNKEWKKKYVTLETDGRITYHPSLHDYMEDVHGKEIPLIRTTVKVPGQRPRACRTVSKGKEVNGNVTGKGGNGTTSLADKSLVIQNSSVTPANLDSVPSSPLPKLGINSSSMGSKNETPNARKRHRRAKSGGVKNTDPSQGDDSDGYEFVIVSLDSKQWHFEANSGEERNCWVESIEEQILTSLQSIESSKSKENPTTISDASGIATIRNVRGNNICADCSAANPDWSSINLGILICIECSGIHRNLGTHISRVRSLDLDEWPPDISKVMTAIGNTVANSVWENNIKNFTKPTPQTTREEKEKFIRAKYEHKEFVPPLPYVDIPVNQQLIDALVREDIRNIVIILGHAVAEDINAPYSKDDGRTALHIAAALGNVVFVQLLLWYNANVKVVDHEGRNALWYARSSGSGDCMDLLANNGCPEHPTLPRRRGSVQPNKTDVFDKLPASVI